MTVKYILFTYNYRMTRVAIGIQNKRLPIVYTMERDDIDSYILYTGCMSEAEGKEILAAAEDDDFAKAIRLFRKYFRGQDSDQVYVEADEWRPISEEIYDDWFDECDQVMTLMETNIRGVFSFDRHNDWF